VNAFNAKKANADEMAVIGTPAVTGTNAADATLLILASDNAITAWEKECKAYDYSFAQRLRKEAEAAKTEKKAASDKL